MRVPYTYLEAEYISDEYDQQVPLKVIAENVNRDFHNNKEVRNVNSIAYVVRQAHHNDGWLQKLEDKWLSKLE